MTGTGPALYATATTAQAVERARSVVVLVGSYDGSGNYGDIAQLGAALELAGRLGPGVLALPVLEREYLAAHRRLAESSGGDPPHALFFDPSAALEDDLLPVPAPAALAFGAGYLYGGGYLNRHWGARKLAMLGAVDALLAAAGAAAMPLVSSGLQVEPEWIAELGEAEGALLRRCTFLGARDGVSRRALAAFAPAADGTQTPLYGGETAHRRVEAAVAETGDDAIGLLRGLPVPPTGARPGGQLAVNVHFAEHGWVTDRPQQMLGFYAELLAQLGRLSGQTVLARPLIAYEDGRIDERPGVGRLRDALAERGVEVGEPRLLRPAGLAELAPWLGEASLTVSCSYHVALTSLMLAVPSLLIADNPYYEQKAAGLAETFGLPPSFTRPSTTDPAETAAEIAPALLDAERHAQLRGALAAAADGLRLRRLETEVELLARLGGGAAETLGDRLEELSERLRLRSAEPVELQARLTALETELEQLRHRAEESPLDAELRAQAAEARAREAEDTLTAALQSRSWRLTAPLRRLGSLPRRR